MNRKRFRLAVVNSHPIQYFAPLYAFVNSHPEIDVTVLYCSNSSIRGDIDPGFGDTVKWDVDLLDGYNHIFLGGGEASLRTPGSFFSLICPEIWSAIRGGDFDAVLLHGYHFAAFLVAMAAARSKNTPVFIRSETHLGLKRSKVRGSLRDFFVSRLYARFQAFLAIGSLNHDYYRSLGIPEAKIFKVPYTVDNERFIQAAKIAGASRPELRDEYGLPNTGAVVLYASKFMRRKHPDDVIAAISQLQLQGWDVSLLMVGTGEMEEELRVQAKRLEVRNVVFAGFVNQSRLPAIYAISDVFVLPSENEPWGLIVNEVMCASLPVIVADGVGCVVDLVKDGVNGALMKAGDVDSLAAALRRVLSSKESCDAMGRESLRLIRKWSYSECLDGILSALRATHMPLRGNRNGGG